MIIKKSFKILIFLSFVIFSLALYFLYFPTSNIGAACLEQEAIELGIENPLNSLLVGSNLYVLGSTEVSVVDTKLDVEIDVIDIGGQTAYGSFLQNMHVVGDNLYIINQGSDSVNVIDLSTNTLTGSILVGTEPVDAHIFGTNLYVANSGSDNISVIDTNTNTVIDTISVGDFPHDIILQGSDIYVANLTSNSVSVIDINTNTVTDTILVGEISSLLFLFGTDLYVADFIFAGSSSVSIIDTNTNTLTTTISLDSSVNNINTDGSFVYLFKKNHTVEIIDPITRTSVEDISVFPPALFPANSILVGTDFYVSASGSDSIFIFDTITNIVTGTIDTQVQPLSMTLVGEYLYVVNFQSNSISVIDTNTNDIKEVCLPLLESAEINGSIVLLTYDEVLDELSVPDEESFLITIDGQQVSVINVEIIDDQVILTTAFPANYGDVVTLSYFVPAKNPIQNPTEDQALPIDDEILINNTTSCAIIRVGNGSFAPSDAISATLVGTNLYANNYESGNIVVIDTLNYDIIETIDVGVGPFYSVLVGTDLYVFVYGVETVIVDTLSNAVIGSLPAGSESYLWGTLVGANLYINNIDTNEVEVLNTLDNTISDTITVGSGSYSSVLVADNLYVFNSGEDTVSVIDTTTNTVLNTITVGLSPYSGTLVGTDIYVSNYGDGTVSVIDTTTNNIVDTINLSSGPQFSVLVGDNLYISLPDENSISVVDTTTRTIIETLLMDHDDQGAPFFINNVRGNIYVSNGVSTIYIIDPDTNSIYDCPDTLSFNYVAGINGSIIGNTSQILIAGENGSPVTAVPDVGYEFIGWSDGSTQNPRVDLNASFNIYVTANFSLIQYDEPTPVSSVSTTGTTVYARFRNLVEMGKFDEAYYLIQQFPHMFVSEKDGEYNFCDNVVFVDFMKRKDLDGRYSAYNGGVVKEISKLQSFINKLLRYEYIKAAGPVDGIFGPLTEIGVKRLQKLLNNVMYLDKDLVVDGIVGPYTRSAINEFCN